MKVLLIQPVEKLGEVGDLVEVADGYARNYLLPKGLAVEPTEHNLKRYAKLKEQRLAELRGREERARLLKEKLDGMVFTFVREAREGRLYGSVRKEDLASRIKEEFGVEVEKGRIELEHPIEEVGTYTVKIGLYRDITAEVKVEVQPSQGEAGEERAQAKAQQADASASPGPGMTPEGGKGRGKRGGKDKDKD